MADSKGHEFLPKVANLCLSSFECLVTATTRLASCSGANILNEARLVSQGERLKLQPAEVLFKSPPLVRARGDLSFC